MQDQLNQLKVLRKLLDEPVKVNHVRRIKVSIAIIIETAYIA